MTQPSASILFRIEQLLNTGKQREARLLLMEYIILNPASARAWWLMSLTINDIDQQIDCLKSVLQLDPENEPARERLAKLISQPPVSPSVSPFIESDPAETEEPTGDIPLAPASALPPEAVPESVPLQPPTEQTANPLLPAPIDSTRERLAILTSQPPDSPPDSPFVASDPAETKEPTGDIPLAPAMTPLPVVMADSVHLQPAAEQTANPLLPAPIDSTRERLAILSSQPPDSPPDSPFVASDPAETKEPTGDIPLAPAMTLLPVVVAETVLPQPAAEQTPTPLPPAPIEPVGERQSSLITQPPVSPSVSPFTESDPAETEEPTSDVPLVPSWAASPESIPEILPSLPAPEQAATPLKPAPVEPARGRLAKLLSQPPDSPTESPFVASDPAETEEPTGEVPLAPAPEAPPQAVPEAVPLQPAAEQTPNPLPPAPIETIRERFAKLINQPKVSPLVSPFVVSDPIETKGVLGDIPRTPPLAPPPGAVPETVSPLSAAEQAANPLSPAPVEPVEEGSHSRKSKTKWGIVIIILAGFSIFVIASIFGYLWLQRKTQTLVQTQAQTQTQAHSLQETFMVAQALTSLPMPTLIPTWTASPTRTALPSATFTRTPTLTPSLQYTLTKTTHPSSLTGPVVGLYAPNFNLIDQVTGQQVTLSQFDGQPVLLFFWSTGCPLCVNEIDFIETITQTYEDVGLVVLTINADEDPALVSAFRIAHLMTFPILLDPDSVVQSAYNVDAIPGHFFINSSGRIASVGSGEMTLDEMKVQVDAIMHRYPTSTP